MNRLARTVLWVTAAVLVVPGLAFAQTKNWPSERPPRPLPVRVSPFPPYEIRTLENGLQVVVVTHTEQPVVSAQLLVKAGAASDPSGKPGVANLVALLLDQGTTTRAAGDIADAVDTMGWELSVMAGTDVSFVQVTVMKDGVAVGLDMLSDVVRNPAFAHDELERQRQQLRSGLRVSYDDPAYIATVVFERLVFGFHPYGLPGDGTPESIERITRDDLVTFHGQYFAPNNSMLAIVGDVTSAEAFAAAEKVFGGWARREVVVPLKIEVPPPTRRVVVIHKPDVVQTEIRVGNVGMARKTKDYVAADLGVRILGGEGANRLQQVLRTARGLTYSASADLEAYRLSGIVRAGTNTRSEATAEVLRLVVDECFKVQRELVGERELEDAKAYVTGSFPMGLETPGAISTKVLNALFHDLPLKELETHRELVNVVTPEDVNRAMRTYLHPDRLSVVLVGDAPAFVSLLNRVGFKDVEVVPIELLDLTAPNLRRAPSPLLPTGGTAFPTAKPAGKAELAPAEARAAAQPIIERAVAAAGGLDALRAVKTVVATAQTVLTTPEGTVRAHTTTYVWYPDRFRVDAQTPGGEIVQTYAGGYAWVKDPKGVRDAPEPMRQEFAASVRRDWIALLMAGAEGRVSGRRIESERGVGGRMVDVVVLWSTEMAPVRVGVDRETGRLVRLSYQVRGPGGLETVVESFDDFRAVDGIWFPFTAVTSRDNAPLVERKAEQVHINQPIPAGVFDKPR